VAAVTVLVIFGQIPSWAQYSSAPSAPAQPEGPPAQPKGVTSRGLVSSSGGFSARGDVAIVLSGNITEIAPGGQTGRERYLVPAYIYVLEGTLTTDSEAGGTGVGGIQYHGAGQSVPLPPPGTWHNFYNSGQTPVRYLLVFISTPGAATMQAAAGQ
jgi:quercetin dioxygenase-like cupin family protein